MPKPEMPGTIVVAHQGHGLARQITMGLFCSSIVAILMNLLYLKKLIAYLCALLLWACGWGVHPPKGDGAQGLFERGEKAIEKIGDSARHKLEPVKEKAEGLAEAAKHAPQHAKEVLGDVGEEAKARQKELELKITQEKHKAAEAAAARRKQWEADRAVAMQKAQDAEKQRHHDYEVRLAHWEKHGPNGYCPNCRRPIKIPARATGLFKCTFCGASNTGKAIRAMGKPPMPNNYRGANP